MGGRNVLLDTSYVIALINQDDPHHDRAKELDKELLEQNATLTLHWGILLEIGDGFARVGRRAMGIDLLERFVREDCYQIHELSEDLCREALSLYCNRADKDWSLTDCTSFVVMQEHGITKALTADHHFEQAGFVALLK